MRRRQLCPQHAPLPAHRPAHHSSCGGWASACWEGAAKGEVSGPFPEEPPDAADIEEDISLRVSSLGAATVGGGSGAALTGGPPPTVGPCGCLVRRLHRRPPAHVADGDEGGQCRARLERACRRRHSAADLCTAAMHKSLRGGENGGGFA